MFPVAILAGGLATRLGDLTRTSPKALIEVAGRPFIAWQLDMLAREGVDRVVLCVKHLGGQIEAFVGDGSEFGLEVRYSMDGERLLGTGGALRQARPLLGDAFFVMYGDSYLTIDMKRVEAAFLEQGLPALMTVMKNENRWDRSNVWLESGRLKMYSKKIRRPEMQYIDYGLGVLTGPLFDDPSLGEAFDLAEIYERLSLDRRLGHFEATTRFYEVGSVSGIEETRAFLAENSR